MQPTTATPILLALLSFTLLTTGTPLDVVRRAPNPVPEQAPYPRNFARQNPPLTFPTNSAIFTFSPLATGSGIVTGPLLTGSALTIRPTGIIATAPTVGPLSTAAPLRANGTAPIVAPPSTATPPTLSPQPLNGTTLTAAPLGTVTPPTNATLPATPPTPVTPTAISTSPFSVVLPTVISTSLSTTSTRTPRTFTTVRTRPTCAPDGILLCNGPGHFGLCAFGRVQFQPVADGTACRGGAIGFA